MLSIQNRLKKEKDFERVFKQGSPIKGRLFFLKILKTENKTSRIGLSVSKKISNKAVVRNKIKRRLREAVRAELKKNSLSGHDIVIVALPGIKKAGYPEIKTDVSFALQKGYNLNTKQ
jgi:ribonuclease P protein component